MTTNSKLNRELYRSGRHMVYNLQVHIVLVTKYRRGAITDRVQQILISEATRVCNRMDCTLLAVDGEDDHLHLLVSYPPKLSVSSLVMSLKTNTARVVRSMDFAEVNTALWDNHFWSAGYFASSVSQTSTADISNYIANQRKPPKSPGRPRTK